MFVHRRKERRRKEYTERVGKFLLFHEFSSVFLKENPHTIICGFFFVFYLGLNIFHRHSNGFLKTKE